jgi:tetratricopeptide (TPR) repeat protein
MPIRSLNVKNENSVCFEEEVFLEEIGESYVYTFSNDPSDIQKAIEKKTGYFIPVNDTEWRMNPGLSLNLQKIMKEKNVNFCTTSFEEGNKKFTYLNRRCGDSFSIIIIEEDNIPLEFLASIHYLRSANKYNKDNDFSNSIVASTQALKFDPKNDRAYYARGLAYYNKNQFDLAIEDCSSAISIDAEEPSFYILRATLFDTKKQIELAIKDLENAIGLDSNGTYKYLIEESGLKNYSREVIKYFIKKLKKET